MDDKRYSLINQNHFEKIKDIESALVFGTVDESFLPKLSVLIPTYKRAHLLKRALDSAINQTVQSDYEIVVVDNDDNFDSKSATQELAESYSCPYLRYYKNKKNLGPDSNFNRAIELARGEYVAFLHDDDFFEASFVEEALKNAKGDKALFFRYKTAYEKPQDTLTKSRRSFSKRLIKCVVFYPIHLLNPKKNQITLWDMFLSRPKVGCIANVYKRGCLIDIGGFNSDCYPASDYNLNIRYIMRYGARHVGKIVGNYWIGENDSLGCCAQFPTVNYHIRRSLLPYLNGKSAKKLERIIRAKVAEEIVGVQKGFDCDISRFDQDMLEIACQVSQKERKKLLRETVISYAIRYFD